MTKTILTALTMVVALNSNAGWFEDDEQIAFGNEVGFYSCWDDEGKGVFGFTDEQFGDYGEDFWKGYRKGCELGTSNAKADYFRNASGMKVSEFSKDKFGYILDNQDDGRTSIMWVIVGDVYNSRYK